MIGPSLTQYRITATLGAGGMGEVFRARDTRLNRDVAVKVLPKDFIADADRLRRFEITDGAQRRSPGAGLQIYDGRVTRPFCGSST